MLNVKCKIMARLNIHSLSMQISRMFEQGQSFFCAIKVQDWLRERNENPDDYEISFIEKPAPRIGFGCHAGNSATS